MFPYYGGKKRLAPRYPSPVFGAIVEPFAGGAAYSCLYPDRAVTLIEKDALVVATWRRMIAMTRSDVDRLPRLGSGDRVDDVAGVSDEDKLLLRWWASIGVTRPTRMVTARSASVITGHLDALAVFVPKIKHWQVIEGDYRDAPDVRATWFVDPPYVNDCGSYYRHNNAAIDFDELGGWCRSRRGQVIVCEQQGADWLPFRPLVMHRGMRHSSVEVIYTQGPQGVPVLRT